MPSIALDATYSIGSQLTGVGVYCRKILTGLAGSHPEQRFEWAYRPHRFLRSLREPAPSNVTRRPLLDQWQSSAVLFHGLNQRLPRWRARRTVSTFHDLFVMTGNYSTPEFRERFTAFARDAADRSDLIIAVSAFTAGQVEELLGVERARLRVIHHGVERPTHVAPTAREPIVLHVGAIQERKNIRRLLEAFQAMPKEWRLLLVGSVGFGGEQILRDINDPRIEVLGFVDDKRLNEIYAKAAMFAFPSLDEGFGMPVLEAMAHGVPVIASKRAALPEVCGDAAWRVDASDTEELSFAMNSLAQDTSLRETYAQRGLLRVQRFTWDQAVDKSWRVYAELLG